MCKLSKFMRKFYTQMQGNALFSGKIYTAGKKFTQPPKPDFKSVFTGNGCCTILLLKWIVVAKLHSEIHNFQTSGAVTVTVTVIAMVREFTDDQLSFATQRKLQGAKLATIQEEYEYWWPRMLMKSQLPRPITRGVGVLKPFPLLVVFWGVLRTPYWAGTSGHF